MKLIINIHFFIFIYSVGIFVVFSADYKHGYGWKSNYSFYRGSFDPAYALLNSQDQTSTRANTLIDDADDIQKQLDNEAKDRFKVTRPKTVWVFHFPSQKCDERRNTTEDKVGNFTISPKENEDKNKLNRPDWPALDDKNKLNRPDWSYQESATWSKNYCDCGGRCQSPIDVPLDTLVKTKHSRGLMFCNYDVIPQSMVIGNDGARIIVEGNWQLEYRPMIAGGALHSRRYLFHSLTLHWFSEHTVGGIQYPVETQALHVAAEYRDFEHALNHSQDDPQAFLGISTLYRIENNTDPGLMDIITKGTTIKVFQKAELEPKPLHYFCPLFSDYVYYQGSFTAPPCTESVVWMIRGRTLSVDKNAVKAARGIQGTDGPIRFNFRPTQPHNDRRIYYLH